MKIKEIQKKLALNDLYERRKIYKRMLKETKDSTFEAELARAMLSKMEINEWMIKNLEEELK